MMNAMDKFGQLEIIMDGSHYALINPKPKMIQGMLKMLKVLFQTLHPPPACLQAAFTKRLSSLAIWSGERRGSAGFAFMAFITFMAFMARL